MMTGLGPLLASLVAVDIAALMRRLKKNAILYGFALLFLLTAYVLAIAALAVHLGQSWGLPLALLVAAGGALVLALVMLFWIMAQNQAEARRRREAAAVNSNKALMVTAAVSALPLVLKSKPVLLASIAAGLGFAATRAMGGRRDHLQDPPQ